MHEVFVEGGLIRKLGSSCQWVSTKSECWGRANRSRRVWT
jgi:hypothetical protein